MVALLPEKEIELQSDLDQNVVVFFEHIAEEGLDFFHISLPDLD